jgi:hypothetical protein
MLVEIGLASAMAVWLSDWEPGGWSLLIVLCLPFAGAILSLSVNNTIVSLLGAFLVTLPLGVLLGMGLHVLHLQVSLSSSLTALGPLATMTFVGTLIPWLFGTGKRTFYVTTVILVAFFWVTWGISPGLWTYVAAVLFGVSGASVFYLARNTPSTMDNAVDVAAVFPVYLVYFLRELLEQ